MKFWKIGDFPFLYLFPGDINLLADESKDSKYRDEKKVSDGHANKNWSGITAAV